MVKLLSELPLGSIVRDTSWKHDGKYIEWILLSKKTDGTVTLLVNRQVGQSNHGTNSSNLDIFLKKFSDTFSASFSENVRLTPTTYDRPPATTYNQKAFILSADDYFLLGSESAYIGPEEGHYVDYYLTRSYRSGSFPDPSGRLSIYVGGQRPGTERRYVEGNADPVRYVRPAVNINNGIQVTDNPDVGGVYDILFNLPPALTLSTSSDRTLYESDTYGISGTAQDPDSGDVVMIKYKINNGTARTIASPVSTGAEFPFNRSLTFKEGKLFDGATAVTSALAEGTQHVLTVWAEDDKGGKSAEQTRTFYVVPNRPPKLTVDPITPKTDMIDSDSFEIKGTVNNPDANGVKVHYKIGNSAFNEVYTSEGAGGEFSFRVTLSQLTVGPNSLSVRATDHFGAVDTKTITITKAGNVIPLKTAVTRYKMLPPNGTAKGILLWIEREVGDLVVDARISMTAAGEPEHFVPMTKNKTAFVSEGIEEDEYLLDAGADKSNIILEITQKRTSTASEKGITKITGVFA